MNDPQRYSEPLGALAAWGAWRRACIRWVWPALSLALLALVFVACHLCSLSGAWIPAIGPS